MALNTSTRLSRSPSASAALGGSEAINPTSCNRVVLHNVTQRPDRVIETPPVLYAEVLGHSDLYGPDVVAVPERLEDGVGEPQEQDVHGRFLAEEVVNAQDLPFREELVQFGVQGPGRCPRWSPA
jgi:hypothetical protein